MKEVWLAEAEIRPWDLPKSSTQLCFCHVLEASRSLGQGSAAWGSVASPWRPHGSVWLQPGEEAESWPEPRVSV